MSSNNHNDDLFEDLYSGSYVKYIDMISDSLNDLSKSGSLSLLNDEQINEELIKLILKELKIKKML